MVKTGDQGVTLNNHYLEQEPAVTGDPVVVISNKEEVRMFSGKAEVDDVVKIIDFKGKRRLINPVGCVDIYDIERPYSGVKGPVDIKIKPDNGRLYFAVRTTSDVALFGFRDDTTGTYRGVNGWHTIGSGDYRPSISYPPIATGANSNVWYYVTYYSPVASTIYRYRIRLYESGGTREAAKSDISLGENGGYICANKYFTYGTANIFELAWYSTTNNRLNVTLFSHPTWGSVTLYAPFSRNPGNTIPGVQFFNLSTVYTDFTGSNYTDFPFFMMLSSDLVQKIQYTSGGPGSFFESGEGILGETITGASSGATGTCIYAKLNWPPGEWGTGVGSGYVYLKEVNGVFVDGEDLNGSVSGANRATTTGPPTPINLWAEYYLGDLGGSYAIKNVVMIPNSGFDIETYTPHIIGPIYDCPTPTTVGCHGGFSTRLGYDSTSANAPGTHLVFGNYRKTFRDTGSPDLWANVVMGGWEALSLGTADIGIVYDRTTFTNEFAHVSGVKTDGKHTVRACSHFIMDCQEQRYISPGNPVVGDNPAYVYCWPVAPEVGDGSYYRDDIIPAGQGDWCEMDRYYDSVSGMWINYAAWIFNETLHVRKFETKECLTARCD